MSAYIIQEKTLTDIADAVREKSGTSDPILVGDLPAAISDIQTGGADSQWDEYWLNTATHHDLPDGLTTIPRYAFYGHDKLETINIPDTVTTIGSTAFRGCSELGLGKLPSNLEVIDSQAFYSCYKLCENLEIPSGVRTIGSNAFQLCDDLLTVTFKGTPESIGSSVFSQSSGSSTRIKVINAPWAEGEVPGAPWGASKATINYNYSEE